MTSAILGACSGSDGAPGAIGPSGASGSNGTNANDTGSEAGAPPAHAPIAIAFADVDPTVGRIEGLVRITKAADESDVTSYAIYYGKSTTEKLYLTPIVVLPKTGSDLSYPLVADPPPVGAPQLLAFAENVAGESALGAATAFHEGTPAYADISAGRGTFSALAARTLYDATNDKVLVVTDDESNSNKPALFRCNTDGTSCTSTDISAGQGTGSGGGVAVIDTTNQKLLVATCDLSNSTKPSLFRCNLDGTSCTWADISAGRGATSADDIAMTIDYAAAKLLVVTEDGTNSDKPSLFRCNLDGTACTWTDISLQGPSSGQGPSVAVDTTNGKLLVVNQNVAQSNRAGLTRCNLDGTSCEWVNISVGQPAASGLYPSLGLDVAGGKILVAVSDGATGEQPVLIRCNLDGTSCSWIDISLGHVGSSGTIPSLVVDAARDRLLVAVEDQTNSQQAALIICRIDGTSCTWTDFSAGQPAQSGENPNLAIDPMTGRFFMATDDVANDDKPGLFFLN